MERWRSLVWVRDRVGALPLEDGKVSAVARGGAVVGGAAGVVALRLERRQPLFLWEMVGWGP